jgi:integrase
MPRLSNSLPKYRKHRGSGQAIVTLSGVDHYLGPHGTKTSRLEYDRLIAEWLVNGRQPLGVSAGDLTVEELIVHYWQFAQGHYVKNGKPSSELACIKIALRPVRELYGSACAAEFGPLALKAIRLKLIESGLSRGTVNQNLGRIKRMFKWGVSEQLVPAETFQALATVTGLRRGRSEAREKAPIMPVVDAIVDATLEYLPDILADMVRLQRFCGCRPEEVCALRPCDLDCSRDVWTYQPESHKTEHHGRERMIFVGPKAQEVLLRYLARDALSHCFRPCDSEAKRRAEQERNRKTSLSCGNVRGSNVKRKPKRKPGTQYTTDSYRRAIHRACDKAGIDRWSPNRLRHSTATDVRKEFGLEGAQIILGHASADVSQVYAERDIAKGLEIARRIG